ncbi:MAG TPA: rhomboid family intramembrane serine protease [Planctomycetota bacterium]|jgi:rhomboid protease GluP|nr:rhomboid family intramembrane serine protease [Planctomycetota bacterium]
MSRGAHSIADRILEVPITCLFTAIVLGVFAIAWTHGEHEGISLSGDTLRSYGAMHRVLVSNGDYWRLLTAMFMHANWLHLLLNTYMLFTWGGEVERTVGSVWFSFAYVTTGLGASAVSVLSHSVTSVGASGALFGIVAVVLAILYRRAGSWESFMSNPGARSILVQSVVWILIGFSVLRGIDNYAHLGGFAFGIPCGLLLEGRRGRNRNRWIAGLAAYILLVLGVVVAACIPGLGFGE